MATTILTPTSAEERLLNLVRHASAFRATPDDVSRWLGVGADEASLLLDELVTRSILRRHEVPAEGVFYWS